RDDPLLQVAPPARRPRTHCPVPSRDRTGELAGLRGPCLLVRRHLHLSRIVEHHHCGLLRSRWRRVESRDPDQVRPLHLSWTAILRKAGLPNGGMGVPEEYGVRARPAARVQQSGERLERPGKMERGDRRAGARSIARSHPRDHQEEPGLGERRKGQAGKVNRLRANSLAAIEAGGRPSRPIRRALILAGIVMLYLLRASDTFVSDHATGDQRGYVGIAMKLQRSGFREYNLFHISRVAFPGGLEYVWSQERDAELIEALRSEGMGFLAHTLFHSPPLFPYFLYFSHRMFAPGIGYDVLFPAAARGLNMS